MVQRSATKARTQAVNQLHALVLTAPEELRARLRDLNRASCSRPARRSGSAPTTTPCPRSPASRCATRPTHPTLDSPAQTVTDRMRRITTATAPELVAKKGVGPDTAATLLVTAGDNPDRLGTRSPSPPRRQLTDPGQQRPDPEPVPAQPRRRPTSQRSTVAHRDRPHGAPTQRTRDYVARRVKPKAKPRPKPSAASSATSPEKSSTRYLEQPSFDSRSITYPSVLIWRVRD